jgi:hypothetical protein
VIALLKPIYRYILWIILINILIIGTGFFLISLASLSLLYSDIAILSSGFSIITGIILIIFFKGQTREPESQTLHTLTAVSFKFLLEIILALLWFIVAKKISLQSVIMFFVIYLTLALFSVWVILKTLKNRSL